MADPLSSTFQTQDIPEYLRPFRNALLSSAFSSVYTPEAMKNFLPNATYFNAYTQNQPNQQQNTAGNTGETGTTGNERNDAASNEDNNKNAIFNALNMISGKMPKLPGLVWDTNTRTYVPEAYKTIRSNKGGELNSKEDPIQKILDEYQGLREKMPVGFTQASSPAADAKSLPGGVSSPGFRNPFDVTRGPSQVSSYTIGDNVSPDITRVNPRPIITPGVVPPVSTSVTTPPGGGGGVGTIGGTGGGGGGTGGGGAKVRDPSPRTNDPVFPGTGGGTGGGGGGTGPVNRGGGTGGGSGIGSLAPISSSGLAGTTTDNQGAGGYNPLQYATDDQARGLASLLGGTNQRTNTSGPLNVPSQNQLGFGGSDTFNAGLIQQQLRPGQTPSEMTSSLARLRAEVSGSGGDTSAIDRLIQQNNQAYASGARVSPVGQPPATSTPPPAASKPPSTTTPPATEPPPDRGTTPLPRSGVPGRATTLPDVIYDRIPEPDIPPPVNPDPDIPEPNIPEPYNPEPESSIPEPEAYNPETYSPETSVPEPDGGGVASLLGLNQSNTPESYEPDSYTPESYAPEVSAPDSYTPDSYTPDSYTPEVSAPESYAPDSYTPEYYAPEESAPESYTPDYGSDQSLASFDIGDDGRVNNYRKGGSVRRFVEGGPNFSLGGFGAPQVPLAGGFGGPGGAASLFKTANPTATGATQDLFNAPPVYGGQRTMLFGQDFGQGNKDTGYTASNLTRNALSGVAGLGKTSIFDDEGQIRQGTDFKKGVSAINSATDLSGGAAEEGARLIGASRVAPEQSYLMSLMPGIQKMGFQDAIKVNPISSPNMINPMGVSAANLQGYQMAQPMGVSGQNIDVLGQLGNLSGTNVQNVPQVQQFQMQGPDRVASGQTQVGQFGQQQAQQYMSPYMDAVTEMQKRDASRTAGMQKASRGAAAVRAGAFGGSRQAIQEGMAEEALQRQLGDIDAVGRQKAFEGAQAQFDRDRAASLASQQTNVQSALQAALANQQSGLTTGRENLGANLSTQQLGAQTGLQAALANQQAAQQAALTGYGTRADVLRSQSAQNLQADLANQQAGLTAGRENLGAQLSTQQLGAQQALQAQLANQQAGLTAGQANLQSSLATQQLGVQSGLEAAKATQYGDISMTQMQLDAAKQASAEQEAARQRQFNNRLAAIQQGSASAGALAGMGGQMMSINPAAQQLEIQRLAAMQQAGGAVDARTQEAMNLQYQDFINQQNAPYQQMNFLQGIMSGIPTGMQTENVQFARPASGGLSGLLTAGAGLASNYYANQKT